MKLWIDDMRDAPDSSWTEVRKVQPAITLISIYKSTIEEISIDHDIENRPDNETFKPVAHYIGAIYLVILLSANGHVSEWKPKIKVHSDNPIGAKDLQNIFGMYGLNDVPWEPFTSHKDFKEKYGL